MVPRAVMLRRQLNLAFSCHCDATTWNRLPIFHACFSAGFLSRLYQTFGHVSFVCLASHRRHRAAAPTLAVKSRVAGTQASLCSQLEVQPNRLRLRNSQNQEQLPGTVLVWLTCRYLETVWSPQQCCMQLTTRRCHTTGRAAV